MEVDIPGAEKLISGMIISDRMLDSINFPIQDLEVNNVEQFRLADFAEYESSSYCNKKFLRSTSALLDRLNVHNDAAITLPDVDDILISEVYTRIACLEPPFTVDSEYLSYRILHFLVIELQLARLAVHSNAGGERRAKAAERGRVAFQLDKICRELDLSPIGTEEAEIVREISVVVAQMTSKIPAAALTDPPRILPSSELREDQKAVFERITESFYQDFSLRRTMLMKRLDVTIESFLWGDKAQGKEGEIVAAIKEQRNHLSESTTKYAANDTFIAPASLLREVL